MQKYLSHLRHIKRFVVRKPIRGRFFTQRAFFDLLTILFLSVVNKEIYNEIESSNKGEVKMFFDDDELEIKINDDVEVEIEPDGDVTVEIGDLEIEIDNAQNVEIEVDEDGEIEIEITDEDGNEIEIEIDEDGRVEIELED